MSLKLNLFVDLLVYIRNIKDLLCLTVLIAVNNTFIAKIIDQNCHQHYVFHYQYQLAVDIYNLNESLFLASSLTTERTSWIREKISLSRVYQEARVKLQRDQHCQRHRSVLSRALGVGGGGGVGRGGLAGFTGDF